MKRELLIGCGRNLKKQLSSNESDNEWSNLLTLDINPDHKPDIVWNLENIPLPFEDNTFDEIHAYEVLEHTGSQGDYKFFFAQFEEFYRILTPGGLICATVPNWQSPWAWGDPSHKRVILLESLTFLSQQEYINQVGKTPMSDFRYIYKADFDLIGYKTSEHNLAFILKAVKPSRIE
jgi:SAM-dependent methyltransferase